MEEGVSIQRCLLRFYGLVSVVVPTLDEMGADDATGRTGGGLCWGLSTFAPQEERHSPIYPNTIVTE